MRPESETALPVDLSSFDLATPRPAGFRFVRAYLFGLAVLFGAKFVLERYGPVIPFNPPSQVPFIAGCAAFCVCVLAAVVRAGSIGALAPSRSGKPAGPVGYALLLVLVVLGAWIWGRAAVGGVDVAHYLMARTPVTLHATYAGTVRHDEEGSCPQAVVLATEQGKFELCTASGKGRTLWADAPSGVRPGTRLLVATMRGPDVFVIGGLIFTGSR